MEKRVSIKYFPFAPGIPWKLYRGKYVIPEIVKESWDLATADRDAVILAHGGLLESFFSLSMAEALNKIEPNKRLLWAGNEAFKAIPTMNGLAKLMSIPDIREKYPVPLFFSQDSNLLFFNCLNNYLFTRTYYGTGNYGNSKPVLKQISSNFLIDWKNEYLPVVRHSDSEDKYQKWAKSVGFKNNGRYIVVLADDICHSLHDISCLDWNMRRISELAALVKRFGFSVVSVSPVTNTMYFGTHIFHAPADLEIIINLLMKAKIVLSKQIDFLFLAMMLGEAHMVCKIISKKLKHLNLYQNADFLGASNVISTMNEVTPLDVQLLCKDYDDFS